MKDGREQSRNGPLNRSLLHLGLYPSQDQECISLLVIRITDGIDSAVHSKHASVSHVATCLLLYVPRVCTVTRTVKLNMS